MTSASIDGEKRYCFETCTEVLAEDSRLVAVHDDTVFHMVDNGACKDGAFDLSPDSSHAPRREPMIDALYALFNDRSSVQFLCYVMGCRANQFYSSLGR